MTNLPASSPYRLTPGEPVDERRRTQLAERLNEAYASGAVDDADFQNLLDTVHGATTMGQLAPVAERLPGAAVTYDEPEFVRDQGRGAGELEATQNGLTMTKYALLGGGVLLLLVVVLLALLL